uniref:Uncharacterized protein n=1 Tax=Zea mays TaxID=4577 RepID=A0A804P484_MAIZE
MEACVDSFDSKGEECAMREDRNVEEDVGGVATLSLAFLVLLTLRSMKSLIMAGLLTVSGSTSHSPVSMATTLGMSGRCLVTSCVHSSPTFRNLQACATSRSPPPKDLSMILSRLPCS